MQKRFALTVLAAALACALVTTPASAGVESILGKWQVKAIGPNGPLDVEFAFRLEGSQIVGMANTERGSVPFSAVKFEEPNLAMDLTLGEGNYRLKAVLKNDVLDGTWERVDGDMKGTWTGKRSAPAAPAGGIMGAWSTVAVTPNGEMAATLEIKQADEKLSGVVSTDMGSLPVQAISFKESKLQFDIELGGSVYRVQAALDGDKLDGAWAPAAGGEGGAWRAVRKVAAASAPQAVQEIVGSWSVVAVTPEGNMQFVAELAQAGEALKGALKAPDGSIEMKNVAYANSKLTFEVDYMGGTYRIEATLANDKLTGKWAAVAGSESGTLTGERKKP